MFSKSALVFLVAVWCAAGWAVAQTPNTATGPHDSITQAPVIHAESNLVLVPVFVLTHDGLERRVNPAEWRCIKDEGSRFSVLSAEQPYLPKACWESDVRDLTLNDFQLSQDGEPQVIKSLKKESWPLAVRDNRNWYTEFSDAATGVWSSADIDHSLLPWDEESYYLLTYVSAVSQGCHRIQVKVRRPRVRIFARDEYCAEQTPSDLLNGTKIGKELEHELAQNGQGKIPLFVQAGAFGSGADKRLVEVVIEFPWSQLNHSWDTQAGRLYASIGVLGAVYARDGKLVTRFSDLVWPSYWLTTIRGWQPIGLAAMPGDGGLVTYSDVLGQELLSRKSPAWLPSRYETQFELPPGEYELRVMLSDGTKSGRAEVPVVIENYNPSSLALGSVFLCNRFRDAHVAEVETAAANFAPQYVPLVSKGVRVTPAGDTRFDPDDQLSAYFEIYEPQVAHEPAPQIQAHMRIVDERSAVVVKDFPPVDAAPYVQPGSTTIPIAREVPIATLPKGPYRLEVQASDSAGRSTPWSAANFTITGKN